MSYNFPDPPTDLSLADARRVLSTTRSSVSELDAKIEAAEAALAQVVRDSKCLISVMQDERANLQEQASKTMAYLSPIRRLPTELLRDIFLWSFEEHPCFAWVLAAVCNSWRRLALRKEQLIDVHDTRSVVWTTASPSVVIRLLTTQHASADTIRLWLERSGDTVPLDIEIFLRVTSSGSASESSSRRRRRSRSRTPSPPPWSLSFAHNGVASHYVIPPSPLSPPGITILPPAQTPIILPPSPGGLHDTWLSPHHSDDRHTHSSRSSLHWGHIAIYYLAEQMHRWERFIFRFDKQFTSMGALKSISGDAPLLKEFEVSSAEAAFYPEWQWLPNAPSNATLVLPSLQTLTLQYTPFKWSSPMLRTNLHTLTLRALPTSHHPLDRILYIVANNPSLESLTLHFQGVLPAVLPLTPTTLAHVKKFHVGGHFILSQLVDTLVLPALVDLTLDIEAREPIEDTITNLLTRSSAPSLTHLSIAYGTATNPASFYYGPSGTMISWSTLLVDLAHLQSLHIGGTPLEPLLAALGVPDDDTNQMTAWGCPKLEVLGMRNCHAHTEGVVKLVQMVEARNPPLGGGGGGSAGGPAPVNGVTPARLRSLEMYDCASLGEDVVQWLHCRIGEVVCTEPDFDR
ncbi:hypothetical protein D9615_004893 [Tricholomella constricta]|uniref:F-box domain-containing protein n=1 Tax=Tricholomella constricta TaxID=117010 RepID=A0A8H5HH19_9AGAR|nr:hypothetical protein D9615_004893 [Tricholomella constricta]